MQSTLGFLTSSCPSADSQSSSLPRCKRGQRYSRPKQDNAARKTVSALYFWARSGYPERLNAPIPNPLTGRFFGRLY
ncbi:hypothetical protein BDV12DRAFT_152538 [Aspergillus spectabilis]